MASCRRYRWLLTFGCSNFVQSACLYIKNSHPYSIFCMPNSDFCTEVNTHFKLSPSGWCYLSAKPTRQTLAWSWRVAVCVETVMLIFSFVEQGSIISQLARPSGQQTGEVNLPWRNSMSGVTSRIPWTTLVTPFFWNIGVHNVWLLKRLCSHLVQVFKDFVETLGYAVWEDAHLMNELTLGVSIEDMEELIAYYSQPMSKISLT